MADALPTAADVEVVATGLRFPEGPVAVDDGSVLFVELAAQTVSRLTTSGTVERVADVPGGPNGLAAAGDAHLVCNNGGYFSWTELDGVTIPGHAPGTWSGGSVDRLDVGTGRSTSLYTHCGPARLQAPNDLVVDGHGGFWFTDHGVRQQDGSANAGQAGLYYARVDGSYIVEAAFGLDAPNGVGLSPDRRTVHVAETHTGRLWSWPVEGPGVLGHHPASPAAHGGRLLYDAPSGHLFDSLAVDDEGYVCVGTLGLEAGGLTVVHPGTGEAQHVALGDPLVTNLCFGGPDRRTAWCTGSGTGVLFTLPWPRPGLALAT